MRLGYHHIKGKDYVVLSQSFIKSFLKNGEQVDYCPYQIKRKDIDKKYRKSTDAMDKGTYFESYAIGGNVSGQILDLPRLKSGKRSADQKRIDAQIHVFREHAKKYQIDINRKTVQVPLTKVVTDLVPGLIIILTGVADMMSYIMYNKIYHKAIIDLKLTKDVNTTGGDFCWGTPNEMDHLQAYLYHYMSGLPFYYMVYDYKATALEYKAPLPIYIDNTHIAELRETIRKACAHVVENEMRGWQPRPDLLESIGFGRLVPKCGRCTVEDCEFFNNKNFVINKS